MKRIIIGFEKLTPDILDLFYKNFLTAMETMISLNLKMRMAMKI